MYVVVVVVVVVVLFNAWTQRGNGEPTGTSNNAEKPRLAIEILSIANHHPRSKSTLIQDSDLLPEDGIESNGHRSHW